MLCILIMRPLHSFQALWEPCHISLLVSGTFCYFYNLLTPLSAVQMHILWGHLRGHAQPTNDYFPFTEKPLSPAAAIKGQELLS